MIPGVHYEDQLRVWVDLGCIPDDHTTRQHAAEAIGQLLAALDTAWATIDELVDHIDCDHRPDPPMTRQMSVLDPGGG